MPGQPGKARSPRKAKPRKAKKRSGAAAKRADKSKASGGAPSKGRTRKLITLSEISKRTGISMPTLQRYKKIYQTRIPSEGEGRKQRYPLSAVPVFQELKRENLKRRGRPKGTSTSRKPGGLITLSEIGRRTGISYPTLLRYVKLHLERIPHEGEGRSRRYPEAAVAVFQELRGGSKRGRKAALSGGRAASGTDAQLRQKIRELEKAQRQISRQLDVVIETLKKPLQVTIRPR